MAKLIFDQCQTPVENLLAYKEKINENDLTYLPNLFREIGRLRDTLAQIKDVNRVYGQQEHSEEIKISTTALLRYTAYLLESKGNHADIRVSFEQLPQADFVFGDPYLLLQANEAFWTAVQSVCRQENPAAVQTRKLENGKVRILIQGTLDPDIGSLEASASRSSGTHAMALVRFIFLPSGSRSGMALHGVKHKEAIKKLRKNVDVLTLSATPIPRTLHMSLTGIRDMSRQGRDGCPFCRRGRAPRQQEELVSRKSCAVADL